MRYSDDLIEEIRMKNDIVDVISGYVKLQRKGSSYFGLCPFHNEKSPSFSVSPGKQMYYCFGLIHFLNSQCYFLGIDIPGFYITLSSIGK